MRAEETTQGALVVNVLLGTGINHQPMRLAGQKIPHQPLHAGLTSDLVGEEPASHRLLLLAVQFALTGHQ
jgi:hypothetical protein